MSNFIFPLKAPLVIPSNGYPNKGKLIFVPDGNFALTYNTSPDPRNQTMVVRLFVTTVDDTNWQYQVDEFICTEKGFKTPIIKNAEEIEKQTKQRSTWQTNIVKLESEMITLELSITTETDEAIKLDLEEQLKAASKELVDSYSAFNSTIIPEPEFLYINPYSEIVEYFDKTGAITEVGLGWAKNLPFFGRKIGDLI